MQLFSLGAAVAVPRGVPLRIDFQYFRFVNCSDLVSASRDRLCLLLWWPRPSRFLVGVLTTRRRRIVVSFARLDAAQPFGGDGQPVAGL
jgi:hypothetical protein